ATGWPPRRALPPPANGHPRRPDTGCSADKATCDGQSSEDALVSKSHVSCRRALILSLGPEEFPETSWTPGVKNQLVRELQNLYQTEDDSGLHAAAEWLLRQWHEDNWVRRTTDTWAKDKESREKRFEQVRKHVASRASIGPDDQTRGAYPPRWYVNSQTQ